MAKVSKNLKKLRTQKGITQAQLAETIHVTRQAISSWENDRTQPDIDMLVSLSEALGVSVEELIYGERRNVGLEGAASRYHGTVAIVFAVLGSLLVGAGLVMMFVTFWEDFPKALQCVFAFAPLVAAQAFVLYVVKKDKISAPFHESAAVLWCVGVVSTVALINSIFDLDAGYINCLGIDALLCLPVVYLLGSVSSLAFYFYAICHLCIESAEFGWGAVGGRYLIVVLLAAVCYSAGAAFLPFSRRRIDSVRRTVAAWLSVAAGCVLIGFLGVSASMGLAVFVLCAVLLYAADREQDYSKPFFLPGLIGISIFTVLSSTGGCFGGLNDRLDVREGAGIALFALTAAAAVITAVKNRISEWKITKIVVFSGGLALTALHFIALFTEYQDWEILQIVSGVISIIIGAALLVDGASSAKFLPVNLGFLICAAQIVIFITFAELGMLANGALCVALGGALLAVNWRIARRNKNARLAAETEVSADE